MSVAVLRVPCSCHIKLTQVKNKKILHLSTCVSIARRQAHLFGGADARPRVVQDGVRCLATVELCGVEAGIDSAWPGRSERLRMPLSSVAGGSIYVIAAIFYIIE